MKEGCSAVEVEVVAVFWGNPVGNGGPKAISRSTVSSSCDGNVGSVV